MEEVKYQSKKHEKRSGRYKNTGFEIVRWIPNGSDDEDYMWNYYIFVNPRRLITYSTGDRKWVDYYKMYKDISMHGGITYWKRILSSHNKKIDMVGCDYNHNSDLYGFGEGRIPRSWEEVLKDVKETIDILPKDLKFPVK